MSNSPINDFDKAQDRRNYEIDGLSDDDHQKFMVIEADKIWATGKLSEEHKARRAEEEREAIQKALLTHQQKSFNTPNKPAKSIKEIENEAILSVSRKHAQEIAEVKKPYEKAQEELLARNRTENIEKQREDLERERERRRTDRETTDIKFDKERGKGQER